MHHHLKELLRRGEDEQLDYKQEISSARKIAKTMSSFANHRGGIILVGVRDNKTIAGIRTEDEKYMLEMAADFHVKPRLDLEIKEWEHDDKMILECIVPEGHDKPYYAQDDEDKWWAYIRVQDKSLLASKIVLDVLKGNSSELPTVMKFTKHEEILLSYLRENERIDLGGFCQMANLSRRRASRIIVNLIRGGIIRNHTTEKKEFYTLS